MESHSGSEGEFAGVIEITTSTANTKMFWPVYGDVRAPIPGRSSRNCTENERTYGKYGIGKNVPGFFRRLIFSYYVLGVWRMARDSAKVEDQVQLLAGTLGRWQMAEDK
jgi:hypothetical protein